MTAFDSDHFNCDHLYVVPASWKGPHGGFLNGRLQVRRLSGNLKEQLLELFLNVP